MENRESTPHIRDPWGQRDHSGEDPRHIHSWHGTHGMLFPSLATGNPRCQQGQDARSNQCEPSLSLSHVQHQVLQEVTETTQSGGAERQLAGLGRGHHSGPWGRTGPFPSHWNPWHLGLPQGPVSPQRLRVDSPKQRPRVPALAPAREGEGEGLSPTQVGTDKGQRPEATRRASSPSSFLTSALRPLPTGALSQAPRRPGQIQKMAQPRDRALSLFSP